MKIPIYNDMSAAAGKVIATNQPELRYKDGPSGWQIFNVLSDEAQIRAEMAIAKQEHPLNWTEYVINNFHNRFPGGYKWRSFVEEKIKPSFDSEKFKRDFEEATKALHIKKHLLALTVDKREYLIAMIKNYEDNYGNDGDWYTIYRDSYIANGWINDSDKDKKPKQLYLSQIADIQRIHDQRGELYIAMRNKGYSHKELCG